MVQEDDMLSGGWSPNAALTLVGYWTVVRPGAS